jgi:FtsZ-interacting cell division protein ZipA
METWMWVVIAVVVAVVILCVIAGLWWMQRSRHQRTERLQGKFGQEYDRTVEEKGQKQAEAELSDRQERVESMPIQRLSPEQTEQFSQLWTATQARFVDDPGGAVTDADRLVADVMRTRGYPVGDFEQRAADVSVDHPQVVANYRAAHEIAVRHSRAEATTEELRQAMVHYRALFNELLEAAGVSH